MENFSISTVNLSLPKRVKATTAHKNVKDAKPKAQDLVSKVEVALDISEQPEEEDSSST